MSSYSIGARSSFTLDPPAPAPKSPQPQVWVVGTPEAGGVWLSSSSRVFGSREAAQVFLAQQHAAGLTWEQIYPMRVRDQP